jgi:Legionella pneumophila major outer membrane protein precursor
MSRVTLVRAPRWLALALLIAVLGADVHRVACAQNQFLPAPPAAPAGQPMWVGQTPMFQVGPDGAVNVDQPMMIPPGTQPMYWANPNACAGQPCPGQYVPQPYPTPTQWVVPQQQAPPMMMQPQPSAPLMVQPQPPAPLRWTIFGEALWIHPTGVDMAHAQQQDDAGAGGPVPFGEIGVADPDYDIGFRIGGELEFTPCSAIFVQYAFFETTADSSVTAPIIGGGSGAVGSLVHHPNTLIDSSIQPVTATYDIEFQLGDAAYRQILVRNQLQKVSVFAGGRFGQLDQRFAQTGVFGAGADNITTTTSIEFNGGGPMAGIDGDQRIGITGFSVYGKTLVAALAGNFKTDYSMVDTLAGSLAIARWEDDRIVPMLEYELGLAWTNPQGNLRLSAGYMTSHWFNVVTTPVFVDAVQADNYVNVDDTISFDGLVGRAELHW